MIFQKALLTISFASLSIIATATHAISFSSTSPVPEPSTYALMLGGLGLIGFMAHRRKRNLPS